MARASSAALLGGTARRRAVICWILSSLISGSRRASKRPSAAETLEAEAGAGAFSGSYHRQASKLEIGKEAMTGVALVALSANMVNGTGNFVLLALPFFIFAGVIMERGGISP